MKNNFFLLIGVLTLSILNDNNASGQKSYAAEEKAVSKVHEIAEVKLFITKGSKEQPTVLIAQKPSNKFKYYWIKVGLGNKDVFRTAYNFYVDANSLKVFYVDFMVDNQAGMAMIPLEQWRTVRKDPAFQQMHYYKNGKLFLKKY